MQEDGTDLTLPPPPLSHSCFVLLIWFLFGLPHTHVAGLPLPMCLLPHHLGVRLPSFPLVPCLLPLCLALPSFELCALHGRFGVLVERLPDLAHGSCCLPFPLPHMPATPPPVGVCVVHALPPALPMHCDDDSGLWSLCAILPPLPQSVRSRW